MFVNNEITNRGMLHRLLERVKDEVTMDERNSWARSVEGAIKDAKRSSVPMRNRVARPAVVLSAEPALTAVAGALRDGKIVVSREAIQAVRAFMTDGIESPLYGRDPLAARRGADALRRLVIGDATLQRTDQTVPHPTAA